MGRLGISRLREALSPAAAVVVGSGLLDASLAAIPMLLLLTAPELDNALGLAPAVPVLAIAAGLTVAGLGAAWSAGLTPRAVPPPAVAALATVLAATALAEARTGTAVLGAMVVWGAAACSWRLRDGGTATRAGSAGLGDRARRTTIASLAITVGVGVGLLGLTALEMRSGLSWRAPAFTVAAAALVGALLQIAARRRESLTDLAEPSPRERWRLALSTRAARPLIGAHALRGLCGVPLVVFLLQWLEDRWGLAIPERALTAALLLLAGSILAAVVRPGPGAAAGRRTRSVGALLTVGGAGCGVGVALPAFGAGLAGLGLGLGCVIAGLVEVDALQRAVVPPQALRQARALAIAAESAGGVGGALALALVADGLGPAAALVFVAAACAACGLGVLASTELVTQAVKDAEHHRRIWAAATPGATESRCPVLACDGVGVEFDGWVALDEVDLELAPGETVAVLGTNGAGKSTLLRVIAGQVPATRGVVRLNGPDATFLTSDERARRGLAHVDSERALFDDLTVEQSMVLAARAAGHRAPVARRLALDAAEAQPLLAATWSSTVRHLSGGERRVLSLAQALLRRPPILIVDELSIGLSQGVSDHAWELVAERQRAGLSTLVVEQSLDLVLGRVARALFLDAGRLLFDGAPEELGRREDLRVPRFLARDPAAV